MTNPKQSNLNIRRILKKHEKSERHIKEQRKIAEKIAANIRLTNSLSDVELRTYLNNERLASNEEYDKEGCGYRNYYPLHELYIQSLSKKLGGEDNYKILRHLANKGENLSEAVISYLASKECQDIYLSCIPEAHSDWMIYHSRLPKMLLSRTLTEKEYSGILAGDLPFTQAFDIHRKDHKGKLYFLPRKTKKAEKKCKDGN